MMMVGVDVIYYAFTEEIRNYSTKRIQRFLGVAGFNCSPFIRYDIPKSLPPITLRKWSSPPFYNPLTPTPVD